MKSKIGVAFLLAFVLCCVCCNTNSPSEIEAERAKLATMEVNKRLAETKAIAESVRATWDYEESKDAMTDKTTKIASLTSTNTHSFKFPYEGGSSVTLMVRNKNIGTKGGNKSVFLVLDKGQFVCIESCNVSLRFDDNKFETVKAVTPTDGATNVLFLHPASIIASRIAKSKHLKISVLIYQEGNRIFEFETGHMPDIEQHKRN